MTTTTVPTTFNEATAKLAEVLPNYEARPQQVALATAIEESLASGKTLLAQAGCGTGKSLGYLIPSVLSGQRVVVATATKALQDQLAGKDLPFLAEHLGVDFTYAVLKGRSNYVCPLRLSEIGTMASEVNVSVTVAAHVNEKTLDPAFNGERHELDTSITDEEWRALTVSAEECLGKECPFRAECFAEQAKARAQEADVVVVNQSLYFQALKVAAMTGGNVLLLGQHDVVVFDEAHECADWAGSVLGDEIRSGQVARYIRDAMRFITQLPGVDPEPIRESGEQATMWTDALFDNLEAGRLRAATIVEHEENFAGAVENLRTFNMLARAASIDMVPSADLVAVKASRDRILRRGKALLDKLVGIVVQDMTTWVRWVEKSQNRRTGRTVTTIACAPINVGDVLAPMLWETPITSILVSATLSVDGDFTFSANNLGIEDYAGIDVGTPFEYETQSTLFIPKDLPNPSTEREVWASMSVSTMDQLIRKNGGRALVLFTSTKQMRQAAQFLRDLPFTVFVQGDEPNPVLGRKFAEDETSVLLATRSFFTGIDVPGDALTLVIIDKLPFPVPTEPLTEAKIEAIEAAGGNSFTDFTIPVMSLILQQAFGRLIRHRNDRGTVAILDPRLITKGYGATIVKSLPPAPMVKSINDLELSASVF